VITRLYVHNYRCLENFELKLADMPSCLIIGKNGAGKTTVCFALEVLQQAAQGIHRVRDLVTPDDFSLTRLDPTMRFELEAKIDGTRFEYKLLLELPEDFKELRVAEESLIANGEAVYSRSLAQVTLNRKEQERFASFPVDWHLIALPVIQERSTAEPVAVFRQWLAGILILRPFPTEINGESQGESLLPEPDGSNFGDWFSGLLGQYPSAYKFIDNYLQEVLPGFEDILNVRIAEKAKSIHLKFRDAETAIQIPLAAMSDGEKCFVLASVVLAAKEVKGNLTCFWDEPDNFLGISEVGHFALQLSARISRGGQFLCTSHHPETLAQFPRERTILLFRKGRLGPTQVRPISEIELHTDLLTTLRLDRLDV
jgi:predicted ATPase